MTVYINLKAAYFTHNRFAQHSQRPTDNTRPLCLFFAFRENSMCMVVECAVSADNRARAKVGSVRRTRGCLYAMADSANAF